METQPVRDVILRDGRTMRLRVPDQADAGQVLEFVERLSDGASTTAFMATRQSFQGSWPRSSHRTESTAEPSLGRSSKAAKSVWWRLRAGTASAIR